MQDGEKTGDLFWEKWRNPLFGPRWVTSVFSLYTFTMFMIADLISATFLSFLQQFKVQVFHYLLPIDRTK